MKTILLVQCDIHVLCGRHICAGACAYNIKFMYTSACGDDYSELI